MADSTFTRDRTLDLSATPWFQQRDTTPPPRRSAAEQLAWFNARTAGSKAVRDSLALAEMSKSGSRVSSMHFLGVDERGRIWARTNEPATPLDPNDTVWHLEVLDPVPGVRYFSTQFGSDLRLIAGTSLAYSRRMEGDILKIDVKRVVIGTHR